MSQRINTTEEIFSLFKEDIFQLTTSANKKLANGAPAVYNGTPNVVCKSYRVGDLNIHNIVMANVDMWIGQHWYTGDQPTQVYRVVNGDKRFVTSPTVELAETGQDYINTWVSDGVALYYQIPSSSFRIATVVDRTGALCGTTFTEEDGIGYLNFFRFFNAYDFENSTGLGATNSEFCSVPYQRWFGTSLVWKTINLHWNYKKDYFVFSAFASDGLWNTFILYKQNPIFDNKTCEFSFGVDYSGAELTWGTNPQATFCQMIPSERGSSMFACLRNNHFASVEDIDLYSLFISVDQDTLLQNADVVGYAKTVSYSGSYCSLEDAFEFYIKSTPTVYASFYRERHFLFLLPGGLTDIEDIDLNLSSPLGSATNARCLGDVSTVRLEIIDETDIDFPVVLSTYELSTTAGVVAPSGDFLNMSFSIPAGTKAAFTNMPDISYCDLIENRCWILKDKYGVIYPIFVANIMTQILSADYVYVNGAICWAVTDDRYLELYADYASYLPIKRFPAGIDAIQLDITEVHESVEMPLTLPMTTEKFCKDILIMQGSQNRFSEIYVSGNNEFTVQQVVLLVYLKEVDAENKIFIPTVKQLCRQEIRSLPQEIYEAPPWNNQYTQYYPYKVFYNSKDRIGVGIS